MSIKILKKRQKKIFSNKFFQQITRKFSYNMKIFSITWLCSSNSSKTL